MKKCRGQWYRASSDTGYTCHVMEVGRFFRCAAERSLLCRASKFRQYFTERANWKKWPADIYQGPEGWMVSCCEYRVWFTEHRAVTAMTFTPFYGSFITWKTSVVLPGGNPCNNLANVWPHPLSHRTRWCHAGCPDSTWAVDIGHRKVKHCDVKQQLHTTVLLHWLISVRQSAPSFPRCTRNPGSSADPVWSVSSVTKPKVVARQHGGGCHNTWNSFSPNVLFATFCVFSTHG